MVGAFGLRLTSWTIAVVFRPNVGPCLLFGTLTCGPAQAALAYGRVMKAWIVPQVVQYASINKVSPVSDYAVGEISLFSPTVKSMTFQTWVSLLRLRARDPLVKSIVRKPGQTSAACHPPPWAVALARTWTVILPTVLRPRTGSCGGRTRPLDGRVDDRQLPTAG